MMASLKTQVIGGAPGAAGRCNASPVLPAGLLALASASQDACLDTMLGGVRPARRVSPSCRNAEGVLWVVFPPAGKEERWE